MMGLATRFSLDHLQCDIPVLLDAALDVPVIEQGWAGQPEAEQCSCTTQ